MQLIQTSFYTSKNPWPYSVKYGEVGIMKLNVYGKIVEVIRTQNEWSLFLVGEGKKRPMRDVVIPPETPKEKVIQYLEDIFHEYASHENKSIIVLEE